MPAGLLIDPAQLRPAYGHYVAHAVPRLRQRRHCDGLAGKHALKSKVLSVALQLLLGRYIVQLHDCGYARRRRTVDSADMGLSLTAVAVIGSSRSGLDTVQIKTLGAS